MIDLRDDAYIQLEKQYFNLRKEFEELGGKYLDKEMALAREENMRALKQQERNNMIEKLSIHLRDYKNENGILLHENE